MNQLSFYLTDSETADFSDVSRVYLFSKTVAPDNAR